jgi:hypothetical protein
VSVLRELIPPPYGGFLWGYTGGSPARAAEALLTDALALPTLDTLDKTGPTMRCFAGCAGGTWSMTLTARPGLPEPSCQLPLRVAAA